MKKYSVVKEWVTEYVANTPTVWDKTRVILVKDTATPVIKYYNTDVKKRTCTYNDPDGGSAHSFETIIIGT